MVTTAYTTLLRIRCVSFRASLREKLAQVFNATARAPRARTTSRPCARVAYSPPNIRSSRPLPTATTATAGTCTAAVISAERRSSSANRDSSEETSANSDSPTAADTACSRLAIWKAT